MLSLSLSLGLSLRTRGNLDVMKDFNEIAAGVQGSMWEIQKETKTHKAVVVVGIDMVNQGLVSSMVGTAETMAAQSQAYMVLLDNPIRGEYLADIHEDGIVSEGAIVILLTTV